MWNGKSYDEFQESYQFKSGVYLIDQLESIVSLKNKSVIDLGCGNGKLTDLLRQKTGSSIIAVDVDASMLEVLKEKYSSSDNEVICVDIPKWLATQNRAVDIIFSNATFHWFGSHQAMEEILKDCHKNLSHKGILAIRFSLRENALELKQFLEEKLVQYLGKKEKTYLKQSELEHIKFLEQLKTCGFKLKYLEEIRYTPFTDPEMDFQFMLKSQPIHKYFTNQSYQEFKQYLQNSWGKHQIKLKSHHGVYIAQKL